MNLNANATLMA